ncbi:MAG: preprotein translocase subunit SecE [Candidatus Saccharibacteria bacterium]
MAKKITAKVPKRKLETVRERTEQTNNAKPKSRIVARSARAASTPFRFFGRLIARIARPFRFLLRPFKTRPVRFVGRVLSRVLLLRYFRDSWKELRLVTWPDRKETRQLTLAVFAFAIVFGLMVTVTDYGLDKVFKKLILK